MTDSERIIYLEHRFNILKDAYTDEGGHALLDDIGTKILVPMMSLHLQKGVDMWEYLLNHYYNRCEFYFALTDNIMAYIDSDILLSIFLQRPNICDKVFAQDPCRFHLHGEWFIRDLILNGKIEYADKFLKLFFQNAHGENNPQQNLFETLHDIISSDESRWKMNTEGIQYVATWILKIRDQNKRAQLEVGLADLEACICGKAPKGAIPLSVLREIPDAAPELSSLLGLTNDRSSNEDALESSAIQNDTPSIASLITELDHLVGLDTVKTELSTLINLANTLAIRKQRGIKVPDISLHLVFSGNPGTGKTTVARILGKAYHALGLLSKGHIVETDRSGLVAGYVGQTAIKTQEVIQSAIGGVLFIDEAYALAPEETRHDCGFGQEAINTLLKAMEDYRDDLVVIVAGYPDLMNHFINSNPGLKSRFNKFINFEDYTGEQLYQIFCHFAVTNDYIIDNPAADAIQRYFSLLNSARDLNYGNARYVRNFFEKIVAGQANRLAKATADPSDEELLTIELDDFLGVLDYSERKWFVS